MEEKLSTNFMSNVNYNQSTNNSFKEYSIIHRQKNKTPSNYQSIEPSITSNKRLYEYSTSKEN